MPPRTTLPSLALALTGSRIAAQPDLSRALATLVARRVGVAASDERILSTLQMGGTQYQHAMRIAARDAALLDARRTDVLHKDAFTPSDEATRAGRATDEVPEDSDASWRVADLAVEVGPRGTAAFEHVPGSDDGVASRRTAAYATQEAEITACGPVVAILEGLGGRASRAADSTVRGDVSQKQHVVRVLRRKARVGVSVSAIVGTDPSGRGYTAPPIR